MISKTTFRDTLAAVASGNIEVLELKAHIASSLAATYPESAEAFRRLESEALWQLFRIVVSTPEPGMDPVSDVISPVNGGSVLEMQTGLFNLGRNRSLQSGTRESSSIQEQETA